MYFNSNFRQEIAQSSRITFAWLGGRGMGRGEGFDDIVRIFIKLCQHQAAFLGVTYGAFDVTIDIGRHRKYQCW